MNPEDILEAFRRMAAGAPLFPPDNTLYLALVKHPRSDASGMLDSATECAYPHYRRARVSVVFTPARGDADGADNGREDLGVVNDEPFILPPVPASDIVYWALYDAREGGHLIVVMGRVSHEVWAMAPGAIQPGGIEHAMWN